MLRIAPVRRGGERYYYATVQTPERDRAGLIEADPVWLGAGAIALGLAGGPSAAELRAVWRGTDPATGAPLAPGHDARVEVLAFDLTFSTPKSVSLVHALGRPEVAKAVERAHDRAVAGALGYLEREGLVVRRSRGSAHVAVASGAIAAGFRHRTSRANDPHLHTHVLVANLGEHSDGRWSALFSLPLYATAPSVQAVFEAELRAGLTELGMALGPMRGGWADLAGIDRAAVEEFSRRSREIAGAMREEGLSGGRAATLVADATRPAKQVDLSYEALQAAWRERGYEVGLSASRIDRATGFADRASPELHPHDARAAPSPMEAALERAASPLDGTFTRADLVRARCEGLPGGGRASEIEREVDGLLGGPDVVAAGDRYLTATRAARIAEEADRVRRLGAAAGLRVVLYGDEPGGRLAALDSLGRLRAELAANGGHLVAVAPGRRAAESFAAMTGIDSVPVGALAELRPSLGQRDTVLLADAAAFRAAELDQVLAECSGTGARPVLVGREGAVGRSLLLGPVAAGLPPLELPPATESARSAATHHFGPGLEAVATDTPEVARRVALELAGALGPSVSGVVVVPDRAALVAVRAALAGSGGGAIAAGPAEAARQVAAVRAEGGTSRLIVLGGAATLRGTAGRVAAAERVHVLATGSDLSASGALGRLAVSVRPPHLTRVLGTPSREPSERVAWEEVAERIERYRSAHGLTADRASFGSSRTQAERSDDRDLREEVRRVRRELSRSLAAHERQTGVVERGR